MSQLRLTITTPEKTELDTTVDSVTVPLYDGEIGILPKHSPMVGRLGFGLLRFKQGAQTQEHYIDGGFVQVTGDAVAILTDRRQDVAAVTAEDTDSELAAAMALPSTDPALAAIKDRAVNRARARHGIKTRGR